MISILISTILGNNLLYIFGAISGEHILIVVLALVLLFGAKKIPELMGGIGKGMKEFKKNMKEDEEPKDESSSGNSKEIKE